MIQLPENWMETERGNTLLCCESSMVAWLKIDDYMKMEIEYEPANYPALHVGIVQLPDEKLAAHINSKLVGWTVLKCNVDGVKMNSDSVVSDEVEKD